MTDELDLLRQLPKHAPSDDLRRSVRVTALERLAVTARTPWWRRALDQAAIPLALAAFSLLYLARAAVDTPLLR